MILFYLSKKARVRYRRGDTTAITPRDLRVFHGDVTLTSKRRMAVFANRKMVERFTLFDNSIQPPKMVQLDYPLAFLRQLGAKVPPMATALLGDIFDTRTGEIILEGPDNNNVTVKELSAAYGRLPGYNHLTARK